MYDQYNLLLHYNESTYLNISILCLFKYLANAVERLTIWSSRIIWIKRPVGYTYRISSICGVVTILKWRGLSKYFI